MTDSRPSPPKATLFCMECGHQAPFEEWPVRARDRREEVSCPDCGIIVVSQPVLEIPA